MYKNIPPQITIQNREVYRANRPNKDSNPIKKTLYSSRSNNVVATTPIIFHVFLFLFRLLDFKVSKFNSDMALGSAVSQPRLSSASRRRKRSNQQNIEDSKGGIKFLAWAAIMAAAVTFVMGFTCTKLYISSAPGPGLIKKAIFMVFLMCNTISLLSSVVALTHLIWGQRQSDFQLIQKAMLRAMALVTVAFVSILVAFMVGVCLVLIHLPWQTYF
ncbi:hypothetical protein YC2023_037634 [Brassica napus]